MNSKPLIIGIIGIVLVLVVFHWNHFLLPHYWDEAWVYAPAIKIMAEGVPSPLPDALSIDLSRGHPLLFQFIGGLWLKIFGTSVLSARMFAFTLSGIILVLAVQLTKIIWPDSGWKALLVPAVIALQPIFLSMSIMLYPELLLTIGLLTSIIGYVKKGNLVFLGGIMLMVFSKESSLVFIVAFFVLDLLKVLVGIERAPKLLISGAALILFTFHPISQYVYHGWFFYPEHTSLINWKLDDAMYLMRKIFKFIFSGQGRWLLSFGAIIAAVTILKLKGFWWNLVLLIVGFVGFKFFTTKWQLPHSIWPVVMILISAFPIIIWYFKSRSQKIVNPITEISFLSYFITIAFMVFSAINFFTERYLFPVIVLNIAVLTILAFRIEKINRFFGILLLGVLLIPNITYSISDKTVGEVNNGIYDDIIVHQRAISWLETQSDEFDVCGTFILGNYLSNRYAGYALKENTVQLHNYCDGCNNNYIIQNSHLKECQEQVIPSNYELVFETESGYAFVKIFRIITPQS